MTADKTKLEILNQKYLDLKDEIISRLERIETKVDYTNGKVANAITDIAVLNGSCRNFLTKEGAEKLANQKVKEAQDNCPALKEDMKHKGRDWGMFWAVAGSSVFGSVTTVVILKVIGL